MRYFFGILIGYILGSLSPTYLLSVIKNVDMRKSGTGNLGATNAYLTLGKKIGILVMIFDILKAFLPVFIFKKVYCGEDALVLCVGLFCIIGHVFPFYLKFKGGKGVAAMTGLVLAYNPAMFVILLLFGLCFVLMFNYFFMLPISASTLFPVIVGFYTKKLSCVLLAIAIGSVVVVKHLKNFRRIIDGTEIKSRDYFKGKCKINKFKKR